MAMINVDLDGVEAGMGGGSLLAPGTYQARVVKTECKPTKNQTGECLHVTFETSDGTQLRDFINYKNQNSTCENIGKAQLKLLLECCNKTQHDLVRGTEVMHGVPMAIQVTQEEGDLKDNGVDRFLNNRITKYLPAGSATKQPSQQADNSWPSAPSGNGTGEDTPF